MKKYIVHMIVLIFTITQMSCVRTIRKLQGWNNHRKFSTVSSYLEYAQKSNKLPPGKFIYLDIKGQRDLLKYADKNRLCEYFGAFTDDTTEVKKSAFLNDDLACTGRILLDLDTIVRINNFQTLYNDFFRKHKFYYLNDSKPFAFINNGKLKIFLLYTSKYGSVYRGAYKCILNFVEKHKNQAELCIISLDYGDNGK